MVAALAFVMVISQAAMVWSSVPLVADEILGSCSSKNGMACDSVLLQRLSKVALTKSATESAEVCDESSWPDKDHGRVCGECKVLVDRFNSKYHTCNGYCAKVGRQCVGAWEEENDSCNVAYDMTCDQTIASSDAICQCGARVANHPVVHPATGGSMTIKVASYNLFWWNAFDQNAWKSTRVIDNIRKHLRPDVLGLQECDSSSLIAGRTGYSPASPFKGAQGIMVKSDVIQVGPSGYRDIEATGKWGKRYVTWAQMTHRPTGHTYWHFNTHWCVHNGNGRTCDSRTRYAGARHMLRIIQEVAGKAPVVITGDFNAQIEEPGPQHFLQNGFAIAVNHWVDVVFYSRAHWQVVSQRIGEKAQSDHNPVIAELRLF